MTARRPRPRQAVRALALSAAGLLAVSGLSACGSSPVRAGAAAVVGDTRISSADLAQEVHRGLSDPGASQLAADPAAYQRQLLGRIITSDIVSVAAQREGVTVTQGQVDRQFAALEQSVGGPDQLRQQAAAAGLSSQRVRDLARTQALTSALAQKLTGGGSDTEEAESALQALFTKTAQTLHVSVNPRFGTWDGRQLQVTDRSDQGPHAVSSPAASPGGSALGSVPAQP